jgi:hypothetical protein
LRADPPFLDEAFLGVFGKLVEDIVDELTEEMENDLAISSGCCAASSLSL